MKKKANSGWNKNDKSPQTGCKSCKRCTVAALFGQQCPIRKNKIKQRDCSTSTNWFRRVKHAFNAMENGHSLRRAKWSIWQLCNSKPLGYLFSVANIRRLRWDENSPRRHKKRYAWSSPLFFSAQEYFTLVQVWKDKKTLRRRDAKKKHTHTHNMTTKWPKRHRVHQRDGQFQ